MIYERCFSQQADSPVWNASFHKSILHSHFSASPPSPPRSYFLFSPLCRTPSASVDTYTLYCMCEHVRVSMCVCERERVYGWGGERETQVGFVCSRGNDAGTTKAPAKTPFSWGLSPSLSLWLLLYSLHAPPLTHTNTHIHTHKHRGMHTHIRACLTQSQAALSCVNKSETSTEIQLPDEAAHPANKHTH